MICIHFSIKKKKKTEKENASRSPDCWCRLPLQFVNNAGWHLTWSHTFRVTWFQLVLKFENNQILHFQAISQLDIRWPLTSTCDLWLHKHIMKFPILSINQIWFQSDFNFSNETNLTFSVYHNLTSDDLWPWYVTSDLMNIWTYVHMWPFIAKNAYRSIVHLTKMV